LINCWRNYAEIEKEGWNGKLDETAKTGFKGKEEEKGGKKMENIRIETKEKVLRLWDGVSPYEIVLEMIKVLNWRDINIRAKSKKGFI
jgi:hypothetical protein